MTLLMDQKRPSNLTQSCTNPELASACYYHVTLLENLIPILDAGILPCIGERSRALGEDVPRVYLFTSLMACEEALMNWLGDAFDDVPGDDVVILEIDPAGIEGDTRVEYECAVAGAIGPGSIVRILDESLNPTSYQLKSGFSVSGGTNTNIVLQ